MIKGRQKVNLTKEAILNKISSYDIYRFYLGPFELNEVCINKLRGETNPSLIIGTKVSGGLTHKDFGDYSWRGDCWHFVMQIFRCDFPTALRIVDRDFGLGLSTGKMVDKSPVIDWVPPGIEIKKPPLIQVIYYKRMSKRHLDYWAKLGQGEDDLKRENIYQPKEIWRNRKKLQLGDLITYGYLYEDIGKWKIYRPFAPKREVKTPLNQWKWDSNVPFDYIDNLKAITPECQKVFLTKSKKDRMVLTKALQQECMVDTQAEDPACITPQAISVINKIPWKYIIADNDKKGKEYSWWLTKEHGFKHINVPDKYLFGDPKCTDFADLCYYYGMEAVIEYFKTKGLI